MVLWANVFGGEVPPESWGILWEGAGAPSSGASADLVRLPPATRLSPCSNILNLKHSHSGHILIKAGLLGRDNMRHVSFPAFNALLSSQIREDLIRKSTFSFGHCPKRGGGLPMPEFFGPFFTKLKSL